MARMPDAQLDTMGVTLKVKKAAAGNESSKNMDNFQMNSYIELLLKSGSTITVTLTNPFPILFPHHGLSFFKWT